MTTDQPAANRSIVRLDEAQIGVRLKSPKILVGPLELGLAATYSLVDAHDGPESQPLISLERFKPALSVKDVYLRGRLEIEPQAGRVSYSKKLRLPFLNTEMFKLRLTAQLPSAESSGGVLGRALGVRVSIESNRSYRQSVVCKAPDYSIDLAPRIGPPQVLYDKLGFPGSIYFKAHSTLHVSDSASLAGLRARLDVHSVNAVIRLYDAARVKPCRVGRNLAHAALRLTREDVESEAVLEATRESALDPREPDAIDVAAAKGREWAHALLVNSCVATKTLQDKVREWTGAIAASSSTATRSLQGQATAAAQHLQEYVKSTKAPPPADSAAVASK